MIAMEFCLRPPPPLELDDGNTTHNWKKFKQKLEIFLEATGNSASTDQKKIAILLNCIGDAGLDLFNTFKYQVGEEKDKYSVVLNKFESHFAPKKNIILERFKFNSIKQKNGQSLDKFILDLKSAASVCNYLEEENIIRDRIVFGVLDNNVQERLLSDPDLTLESAIKLCQEKISKENKSTAASSKINNRNTRQSRKRLHSQERQSQETIVINDIPHDKRRLSPALPLPIQEPLQPNVKTEIIDEPSSPMMPLPIPDPTSTKTIVIDDMPADKRPSTPTMPLPIQEPLQPNIKTETIDEPFSPAMPLPIGDPTSTILKMEFDETVSDDVSFTPGIPVIEAVHSEYYNPTQELECNSNENSESLFIRGTRTQFCSFCHKLVTKLPRHLVGVHKDKDEVKAITALPSGSLARKKLIEKLRISGRNKYNEMVPGPSKLPVRRSGGYNCLFCGFKYVNLSRHFIKSHRNEEEIVKMMALPPQSRERRCIIMDLCRRGNSLFSANQKNPTRLDVPCPNCHQLYSKATLYHHYRYCTGGIRLSRSFHRESRRKQLREHFKEENPKLLDMFSTMKEDKVREAILNDSFLKYVAKKLCKSDLNSTSLIQVANYLRQLGRLFNTARSAEPRINIFTDLFNPKLYQCFKDAAFSMGRYDNIRKRFEAPSVPTNLGSHMLRASRIYHDKLQSENNISKVIDVKAWQTKYWIDFQHSFACEIDKSKQKQKPKLVHLVKDTQKLNKYTLKIIDECISTLKRHFTFTMWCTLAKATLSQIVLLNNKRTTESERLLIDNYHKKTEIKQNPDNDCPLSDVEKLLSSQFMKMASSVTNDKPSYFLLSKQTVTAIDTLLSYRKAAGVPASNIYIFGFGPTSNFNGNKAVKEISAKANVKCPGNLTRIQMKKHVASASLAMAMTERDFAALAGFMGHRWESHKHFYCSPKDVGHLTTLSRLLVAVEDGSHGKFSKRLIEKYAKFESIPEDNCDNDQQHDNKEQEATTSQTDVPKQKGRKNSWRTLEKVTLKNVFKSYILQNSLPSLRRCEMMKSKVAALRNRTAFEIRSALCYLVNNKKTVSK